jgi:hypothetical protein
MSIFFAIMFAPLALFLGFLLIRLLMEPAVWLIFAGLGFLFVIAMAGKG